MEPKKLFLSFKRGVRKYRENLEPIFEIHDMKDMQSRN